MLDAATFDRYLARLRLDREAPSPSALRRLQRAHVEHVPYETTWIHMDERWGVVQAASVRRIVDEQRGGYCFHLNGAFALLLQHLGYDVSLHVGGVFSGDAPNPATMDSHLVLLVRNLGGDGNASGEWYVDAGLGDGLHEPLPLVVGDHAQLPFTYALSRSDATFANWIFRHDPAGSFAAMAFRDEPTSIHAFGTRNVQLSRSADSPFVKVVTAQRRDANGVDILRGRVLRRVDAVGVHDTGVTTRSEWFAVLGDVFHLPLDHTTPEQRDRLWARVVETHQTWVSAASAERGASSGLTG